MIILWCSLICGNGEKLNGSEDKTMEGLYCGSDKFDFEKRYCLTVAHLPLSPQLDCEVVVDFFFFTSDASQLGGLQSGSLLSNNTIKHSSFLMFHSQ